MSGGRWVVRLHGFPQAKTAREDIAQSKHPTATTRIERDGVSEVEVTEYTTDLQWTHSLTSPYEQAVCALAVPFAESRRLVGLGSVEGGRFVPHASGWLGFYERVNGELRTRFFGPVSKVTSGVQTDTRTGARNTLRLTVRADSWLSVMSRGFRVAVSDRLNVAGSLISLSEWQTITQAVMASASTSLPTAFETAWERLGPLHDVPPDMAVSDFATVFTGPIQVQGRNLSQLQVPPMRGNLWDVLTSTFQASAFIELFPRWTYSSDGSFAEIVYRMRPPSSRVAQGRGVDYLLSLYTGADPVDFIPTLPDPTELRDVERFSVDYDGSNRVNYIEVSSPYAGASSLAGLSCDPLVLEEDVRRYGLHEYSAEYPYIRDTEGAIRRQLNEINSYVALLFAESHRYGNGTIDTRYTADQAGVGEWVKWYTYGAESVQMEAYVTAVTHRVKVTPEGAVTASSSWTVERASTSQRSDT